MKLKKPYVTNYWKPSPIISRRVTRSMSKSVVLIPNNMETMLQPMPIAEQKELHFMSALSSNTAIPTPECSTLEDDDYDRLYPVTFPQMPREMMKTCDDAYDDNEDDDEDDDGDDIRNLKHRALTVQCTVVLNRLDMETIQSMRGIKSPELKIVEKTQQKKSLILQSKSNVSRYLQPLMIFSINKRVKPA